MSVDGEVKIDVVLFILAWSKCELTPIWKDGSEEVDSVRIVSEDKSRVHNLVYVPELSRRTVLGIARKFDIPPWQFYRGWPSMLPISFGFRKEPEVEQ